MKSLKQMCPYIYSALTQHNSDYHKNVQGQNPKSSEMMCHAEQLPADSTAPTRLEFPAAPL